MRRSIAALAALVAVAVGAPKHAAAQPELESTSPALRVCTTGDYRPFTFRDAAGNFSGMDIDLANDLARQLGVTATFVPTSWADLLTDLDQKCDVAMGGISVTPDRADKALFSVPYLHDGKAAIARCGDAARYRSLADIDHDGVRVIVNPGGTNEKFDREHLHHVTVVEYPDNNTIFDQLIAGDADVMITDGSEIRWQAMQHPALCAISTDQPFTDVQKAYLIPKAGTARRDRINVWLNDIQRSGEYASISGKWLGPN